VIAYLAVYAFAIVEGEIYYSAACAQAVAGRLSWPLVITMGALGGASGDQLWFYLLRGRIDWLDRFPRLRRFRDMVSAQVHANETGLVLVSRFLPGLRTAIPIACTCAGMNQVKFSTLNLVSAFMWASAIMAFVKGGASTLSAVGLNRWWGPFIPAAFVILFFRWLSRPKRPE
jgi:undecaprenyl-diphosphatase